MEKPRRPCHLPVAVFFIAAATIHAAAGSPLFEVVVVVSVEAASVRRHPLAGGAQRRCKLHLGERGSDVGPKFGGAVTTADRGDIEPFMGRDEIHIATATGRIDQSHFTQDIGVAVATHRSHFRSCYFEACHRFNPCFSLVVSRPVFLPDPAVYRGFLILPAGGFAPLV